MILKLNKQHEPLKTTSNSILNKMRKIELLTKNTADEELANKENALVAGTENVVLDRESEPGKTIIKVTSESGEVILKPDTTVLVDGARLYLSQYIQNTGTTDIRVRDIREDEEKQKDAVANELEWLKSDEATEAERKAPVLIQRIKGESDSDFESYDIFVLIRRYPDQPHTWKLKRIGGTQIGNEKTAANYYSYIRPAHAGEGDDNVLVGAVRNVDILVEPETERKNVSDYNEQDGISVTMVNKLVDGLTLVTINE